MSRVSADQVRAFILDRFAEHFSGKGLSPDEVPDDFDLMIEGVVDSLGVIELIAAVEEEYGLELDFEDFDAEELTLLGPFSRFVAVKSEEGSADDRV